MHELLRGADFEWLPLDSYREDFERHFWHTGSPGFWKLERGQYFQEPENDSWQAFARGDWAKSLELIEAQLPTMRDYYGRIADSGFAAKRVRVVEEPVTDYLQWELHVLRARDANGGLVRVIGAEMVGEWETSGPLPEIYTLGTELMYEAIYDETGILDSARKFTAREVIERCRRFIVDLYTKGEPLQSYFDRRVVTLPAPGRVPEA
ncbi:DUF6879 family protein [Actinophytocola xanthii]|uniref:DUF6879 domain-containing protein n=1 Tax=Actinophytocola xanthii TaxID=1912961 RepID=A0A1Q8CLZ7_9PSEU|nr:DUF6879 family protein [Actinophytocola xanthii]OLF15365.1 hypothetical protein BU204_22240 [Actinophytocola xanthii]